MKLTFLGDFRRDGSARGSFPKRKKRKETNKRKKEEAAARISGMSSRCMWSAANGSDVADECGKASRLVLVASCHLGPIWRRYA